MLFAYIYSIIDHSGFYVLSIFLGVFEEEAKVKKTIALKKSI